MPAAIRSLAQIVSHLDEDVTQGKRAVLGKPGKWYMYGGVVGTRNSTELDVHAQESVCGVVVWYHAGRLTGTVVS